MRFTCIREFHHLHLACLTIGALPNVLVAMFKTWASPAIAHLRSAKSPIGRRITDDEGAWLVSVYFLGMILSGLFGGPLIQKFGRKSMLLAVSFVLYLPWLLIAFGRHIELIYLGRFLAGLAASFSVFTSTTYCREISEKKSKKLDVLIVTYRIFGAVVILIVNPFVCYQLLSIFCGVAVMICFFLFQLIPESPYYLLMKGNEREARNSVQETSSIALSTFALESPLVRVQRSLSHDLEERVTLWDFLVGEKYRNSILIMAGLKALQHLSGSTPMEGYMHYIIGLTTSRFSPEISSVIFGGVLIPAVVVAGTVVTFFGRRPIFMVSAIGSAIALCGEGAYFYVQDRLESDTKSIAWLPTVAIAMFLFMNHLGVASLSFVMMAEIFPSNIKISASSAAQIYEGCVAIVVARLYMPLSKILGMYTMLWFFAGHCIMGLVFVYAFMPETKEKSIDEVLAALHDSKSYFRQS